MSETVKPKILENRIFLYITEFFAGVSVMAVELGASRLLAPYFSSSQIVWTIIIGTIMIAMALGNLYGGKSADRNPDPSRLYRRILIAAIWIAAIPVVGKYIIIGISGLLVLAVDTNFLIIAAFISCMVIFVFPLFLLGTVTPSLVKVCVSDLNESGSTVGRLGACNTIGSIIGTFLPTFVTIPAVGTSITFLIFSGILFVIACVYFISSGGHTRKVVTGVVLFVTCTFLGHSTSFAFWEGDLSYEGESVYNYLQVKEDPSRVILSTNVLFGVQSVRMKSDELTGMYYDYALAAPVMAVYNGIDPQASDMSGEAVLSNEDPGLDILVLGNGSGTYADQCLKYFPGSHVEGVEIDGRITDLAYEYFDLSAEEDVYEYDGRAYLQAVDKKYDVILVDAYQDITIPFQMSSVEFFTLVRDHLGEGGVMAVNMNMHSDNNSAINTYLSDTIASVFTYVDVVDVAGSTNRELFASSYRDPSESLEAALISEKLPSDGSAGSMSLLNMMGTVNDRLGNYVAGDNILTDDKAPVELLGMEMIDSLIEAELQYYKSIYAAEGLGGVLRSLGVSL